MSLSKLTAVLVTLAALAASVAHADRTPPVRVPSPAPATGSRPDITVPYTTDGRSTLMGTRVEPKVYSSQSVEDNKNPGARQVFNLPFYGAVQSFGDRSNGAVSKPGAIPLPNR
jgi:hypothetical protein